MDHLLDVLPRASVLEVKGAHHWIHSRALLFRQCQELVCHQDVLNGVVVHHLPIGLRVVDGCKIPIDERVVGYSDCKTHESGTTHVVVHYLQNISEWRTV